MVSDRPLTPLHALSYTALLLLEEQKHSFTGVYQNQLLLLHSLGITLENVPALVGIRDLASLSLAHPRVHRNIRPNVDMYFLLEDISLLRRENIVLPGYISAMLTAPKGTSCLFVDRVERIYLEVRQLLLREGL